jgi:thiol-disulfide isomerase/thioredoxin
MKFRLQLFALLLPLLLSFGYSANAYTCTISGKIIDRKSKTLLLVKASDARSRLRQTIPIVNHSFSFVIDVKETEAYQLIFEDEIDSGAWQPIVFFPISGKISFELHPMDEFDKNVIVGGKLNQDFKAFDLAQATNFNGRWKEIAEKATDLRKRNDYYSPVRDSLLKVLKSTSHDQVDQSVYLKLTELEKTGNEFTANGKALKVERDLLQNDMMKWRYQYIDLNKSIFSYYLLLQDAYKAKNDPELAGLIQDSYVKFASLYVEHPYTRIIEDELNAVFKIKIGGRPVDFSANDLRGKNYRLSTLIKGKIALIDLWGSWCGPCIAATRTMMPVYNDFKDKGFTIVGIAREFKTTQALSLTLKREKYPWLNLIELDDKNRIWNKYGISKGTGMMLLVDQEGEILAIDPTEEEVKKAILARI